METWVPRSCPAYAHGLHSQCDLSSVGYVIAALLANNLEERDFGLPSYLQLHG